MFLSFQFTYEIKTTAYSGINCTGHSFVSMPDTHSIGRSSMQLFGPLFTDLGHPLHFFPDLQAFEAALNFFFLLH